MLVFERFRAFNAYPFRIVDINLRGQGLIRLAGPNGAGKSSLFNLFTQCALGTNPSTAKKSDLIIEDDFLLEITFRKNGSQYVAAQAVKCKKPSPAGPLYGTGVYLFREGQDISMHKDLDTQKLIRATLGWSLEEWHGYVFLQQMSTHTLINGTRSERQNYLSTLFNLQPLDLLHLYFKKKADDLTTQIEAIEISKQELSIKTQMIGTQSVEELLKEKQEQEELLEIMESKLKRLRDEQRKFEVKCEVEAKLSAYRLTEEEVQVDSLKSQLVGLEDEQLQYNSNRLLRQQHIQALSTLAEVSEPEMPEGWQEEYETYPDIDEKREQGEVNRLMQLERTLIEVPPVQIPLDLPEVLNSPDIDLAQVKRQITVIEARPAPPTFPKPTPTQLTALREEKAELSYKILNLKTEVQRLKFNEAECPTCGTKLNCQDREGTLKEKLGELSEVEEELEVLSAKLTTQEQRLQKWLDYEALGPDRSGELPDLRAALDLYEKKLIYLEIQKASEARTKYEADLDEIKNLPEIKERLRIYGLKKAVRLVSEKKQKYESYLKEKKRLENLVESTPLLPSRQKEIEEIKTKIDTAESYHKLKDELSSYGDCVDLSGKITEFEKERSQISTHLGGLQVSIQKLEKIMKEVSDLQAKISSQDKTVRDQKRYALLAKGYGKAGSLRERQLAKFSRYLEEALLTHTIRSLPEHRIQVRVDDGVDILAEYVGNQKPKSDPYDVKFMSGGEKGALSVALLFALDDLHPPERRSNLKILDECESAFDAERQQDFIQYVLPKLKERVETVVVISHSHAAHAGTFDKVWEIRGGVLTDTTSDPREFEEAVG